MKFMLTPVQNLSRQSVIKAQSEVSSALALKHLHISAVIQSQPPTHSVQCGAWHTAVRWKGHLIGGASYTVWQHYLPVTTINNHTAIYMHCVCVSVRGSMPQVKAAERCCTVACSHGWWRLCGACCTHLSQLILSATHCTAPLGISFCRDAFQPRH